MHRNPHVAGVGLVLGQVRGDDARVNHGEGRGIVEGIADRCCDDPAHTGCADLRVGGGGGRTGSAGVLDMGGGAGMQISGTLAARTWTETLVAGAGRNIKKSGAVGLRMTVPAAVR